MSGRSNYMLPGMSTAFCNRAFSAQHACGLHTDRTHSVGHMLMRRLRMLDLNAGKGCQVMKCACACSYSSEWSVSMLVILRYIGCRARGVCALVYRSS